MGEVFSNYRMPDKAEVYAGSELLFVRDEFNLTDEQWDKLCFMLTEAWREGYRTAVSDHLGLNK